VEAALVALALLPKVEMVVLMAVAVVVVEDLTIK
jgi:hypothetical protein